MRFVFLLVPLLIISFVTGCAGEREREVSLPALEDFIVYKHELSAPRNPVCEDFNNDGLTDVAVVEKPPFLNIFLNTENGLQPPVKYDTFFTHNTYLTAVDIDSDGEEDLVPVTESLVGPVFHNVSGFFSRSDIKESAPKFGYFITSGDMDGDGREDLIVLGLQSGEFKVMFNRGENLFQTVTVSVPEVQSPFGGAGLREALISDLNEDGLNDIIIADYTGQRLLVAINDGLQFTVENLYTFDSTVSSIGIFTQHGRTILAVALESSQKVVLLEKGEEMNFRLLQEYSANGYPRRIVISDIDGGDGSEDVIISINTKDSSGYIFKILFNPVSEMSKYEEVVLPGHDCTYLSLCDIYGNKDFLCSDINRNQFFILKKDFLLHK